MSTSGSRSPHGLQGSSNFDGGAKLYHDYDYKLYATLEYLFMILSLLNGKESHAENMTSKTNSDKKAPETSLRRILKIQRK